MSSGTKIPKQEAWPVALEIRAALHCSGAEVIICGSLRRQKAMVGDIDIIIIGDTPDPRRDIWPYLPKCEQDEHAQHNKRIVFKGIAFDLKVFKRESKGAAMLFATGSAAHNIQMRVHAKSQGLKLNRYGVWDEGFNLTAGMDEAEIFDFLGLTYLEPQDRGVVKPEKTWTIDSRSGSGSYVVGRTDGVYSCECKGFHYRGKCRHIEGLKGILTCYQAA